MADAIYLRSGTQDKVTSAAAVASGEIYQLPDGRAGRHTGVNAAASGDVVGMSTEGVWTVAKTASMVIIEGQSVWWDHSANKATITPSRTDRDFFLGTCVKDAASADTTMEVNANVRPCFTADLADGYDSAVVLTTANSAKVTQRGSTVNLLFSTDAEAQKVDALSKQGFALESNWVVEGAVEIVVNSNNAAGDFNIGVASGTNATDADSIAESVFLHVDGAALSILAESDDGTNEQAATDTTVDAVVGTRFHFCIDGRNTADVQIYINGVLVLGDKTFAMDDGSGPLYLLAHAEKTADDSPGEYDIDWLRCVTSEVT